MKRLLIVAASLLTLSATVAFVPLAAGKGAPQNRGCPPVFTRVQWNDGIIDDQDAAQASDTNDDGWICLKTGIGQVGRGHQVSDQLYIDNANPHFVA